MWQKQFGTAPDASGLSVVQTTDGGYVISGTSGAVESSSVLVAKFSATGDILWQKTYGTGYEDLGESVQQTADGGFIVGGEIVLIKPNASTPSEGLLLKLDPQGNIQFQDVFNAGTFFDVNGFPEMASSEVTSVQAASDGSIFLAGRDDPLAGPGGSGPEESWLVKTDANGNVSWQHVFFTASAGFSLFNAMRLTSDGGMIAAGTTDAFDHSDNFWLVKTDASGNVAGGQCTAQGNGTNTTEQTGPLTAATSSFPNVTLSNTSAATPDTSANTSLVTQAVC